MKWLLVKGGETYYPALNVNNQQNLITDDKEKAKEFNNFFLSQANIDETNSQLPVNQDFPQGLEHILATEEEISDFIKCVDPSKTTGPDWVSPKLLKEARHVIVPSLTKLINISLSV